MNRTITLTKQSLAAIMLQTAVKSIGIKGDDAESYVKLHAQTFKKAAQNIINQEGENNE
jgi:hypothetical protein